MVFPFITTQNSIQGVQVKLMAIRTQSGAMKYRIRLFSQASSMVNFYIGESNMMKWGTYQNGVISINGQAPVIATTMTTPMSLCNDCHNGSTGGGGGWDGPGADGDPFVLDDPIIISPGTETIPPSLPDMWIPYWDFPIIIIPETPATQDTDPCNTFENLMDNEDFRDGLETLNDNTDSDRETAFTLTKNSDGTYTISPFEEGPVGGNSVSIIVSEDVVAHGHSHYNTDQYGTFSPEDLQNFYQQLQFRRSNAFGSCNSDT